jgi:UDP-2,4-diacetamido-2,4,6-trideoxy-beta-L-altropyranose hydrolase
MRIAIRTDSSVRIGTGHLMRCSTLAAELARRGAEVSFVMEECAGPRPTVVHRSVAECAAGAGRLDWLVVDHYGVDISQERAWRQYAKRVLVIDDLANRRHDCDVLVDQNLNPAMEARYRDLVPRHCWMLVGPRYVLLRPEFAEQCQRGNPRTRGNGTLLVTFGGSDPTGETEKALAAIGLLRSPPPAVDVVIGSANPRREVLHTRGDGPIRFHHAVTNMAELMHRADLAICAGGTTTWERCCMGLPALVIAVADNQVEVARHLDALGLQVFLGESRAVTPVDIARAIERWGGDLAALERMRGECSKITDGLGAARVAEYMTNGRVDDVRC